MASYGIVVIARSLSTGCNKPEEKRPKTSAFTLLQNVEVNLNRLLFGPEILASRILYGRSSAGSVRGKVDLASSEVKLLLLFFFWHETKVSNRVSFTCVYCS